MKIETLKFKKALLISALGAALFAPIAVVISCGESGGETTPVKTYREKLIDRLAKVSYFGEGAISSKTNPLVVAPDPIAKEYKYLSGNYTSVAEAKAAQSEWKDSLPQSVGYEKLRRDLWIKVTPRTLAELPSPTDIVQADLDSLSGDKQYISITDASKVRNIISDISQQAEFAAYEITPPPVTGTPAKPSLTFPSTILPLPDTKFVFDVAGKEDVTTEAFLTSLAAVVGLMSREQLSSIAVKLAPVNPSAFTMTTPKQWILDTSQILPPINTVAEWEAIYPQYRGKIVGNKVIAKAFQNETLPIGFALPLTTTEIAAEAFSGAKLPIGFSLASLPNIIIRGAAFENVNLPGGFALPETSQLIGAAFYNATFAADYVIPATMTTIPGSFFYRAKFSIGFIIPNTVTTIKSSAFAGAVLPAGVTVPNSVTLIEDESFNLATLPAGFSVPSATSIPGSRTFASARYADGTPYTLVRRS